MRDVDQALAKVYARRESSEGPGLPPPPHFVVEPPDAREGRRTGSPHALDTLKGPREVAIDWPTTVLALEREHGPRFERLADLLLQVRDRDQAKVLLFTSCHRAEGRTTLVLTLARALARRPGRMLLVDADLTGPMMARQLGIRPHAGLDDVIESGTSVHEAILHAPDDHLSLLPLRAAVPRPRDFLSHPEWSLTMARLRREFDLVLIDGSPIFTGLSATILHRSVDAAVLVQSKAITSERALLRAQEVLQGGGIPILGVAETFV